MSCYYIHDVPGRLRIKSPIIKRNKNIADELKRALSTINGIATIDINLITGSLLMNYNPKAVKPDDIVSLLQRKGYYDTSMAVTNDQYIHAAASKVGEAVGKAFFGASVERALAGSPLALIAVFI